MAALEKWNDERLDDLSESVKAMAALPVAVAKIGVQVDNVAKDTDGLGHNLRALSAKLESEVDQIRADLATEAQTIRREFHNDRRTLILTVLSILGPVALAVVGASVKVLAS